MKLRKHLETLQAEQEKYDHEIETMQKEITYHKAQEIKIKASLADVHQ